MNKIIQIVSVSLFFIVTLPVVTKTMQQGRNKYANKNDKLCYAVLLYNFSDYFSFISDRDINMDQTLQILNLSVNKSQKSVKTLKYVLTNEQLLKKIITDALNDKEIFIKIKKERLQKVFGLIINEKNEDKWLELLFDKYFKKDADINFKVKTLLVKTNMANTI